MFWGKNKKGEEESSGVQEEEEDSLFPPMPLKGLGQERVTLREDSSSSLFHDEDEEDAKKPRTARTSSLPQPGRFEEISRDCKGECLCVTVACADRFSFFRCDQSNGSV